jgi:hypothetical protein
MRAEFALFPQMRVEEAGDLLDCFLSLRGKSILPLLRV